ncbi:MAG: RNA-binding protein [Mesorhizobium sp.]|nr:MAG: RNA-binding protein [Mesorhizobium sp.]
MPLSHYSGVYEPADLDLLQRVFDRLCNERRLAKKDRDQRQQLAAQIFEAFDNGLTDETELWRALSRLRGPRMHDDES